MTRRAPAGNSGCFTDIGTAPGSTVVNPGVQGSNTSFYQDTTRTTKQTAFFASFDVDLIPKVLTITAGTRHFKFDNSSAGSVSGSFACFEQGVPAGGCLNDNYNLNSQNLKDTESGFKSRGNITWHLTPDLMLYYTFSQGFRPGGFNQNGGTQHAYGTDGQYQYLIPSSYQSDKLTNNEIGWKTEFLDHRLQWNGAVYRENWDNVQVAFFDPGLVGNIFYNTNGQNFLIKGVETSLMARVISGFTVQGCGLVEPEPADEFAAADRQQSRQRELRQADHPGLRQHRRELLRGHQPVRSGRISQCQCAADPVQCARSLRVGFGRICPVRPGRCDA